MNNGIKIIFGFALGAAAGSIVTWKLLETKYDKLIQEEVDSVKEIYAKREEELEQKIDELQDPTEDFSDEDVETYKNMASEYTNNEEKGGSKSMKNRTLIEVIPPDEFGENDYETVSLTYYADHVLTDDRDFPIEDIDGTIGIDSLSRFGEYEDDSVFVRNHTLKKDYEILMDYREYSQVKNPAENE